MKSYHALRRASDVINDNGGTALLTVAKEGELFVARFGDINSTRLLTHTYSKSIHNAMLDLCRYIMRQVEGLDTTDPFMESLLERKDKCLACERVNSCQAGIIISRVFETDNTVCGDCPIRAICIATPVIEESIGTNTNAPSDNEIEQILKLLEEIDVDGEHRDNPFYVP